MNKRFGDTSLMQDAAPMEQVRELLFGQQLKDMEIRFRRQEERFLREVSDARESLKKRIDSLENFMKSEAATLLHRLKEEQEERLESIKTEQRDRAELLKNEQRERSEAVKNEQRERMEAVAQLGRDIASSAETFERRMAKLSSNLDSAERELRQLMLTESGSLTDKIETKYQDALGVIAKTASQIRDDMVYRTSLSGMFTECALKLSGQWNTESDLAGMRTENAATDVEPVYEAEAHDSGAE
jgi:DNA anti-recombination protein RmuC